MIPFWIYVGFFNSISSLLAQIMEPYGFSEEDSGIAGAVLIAVGLVSAAIVSPIVDRTKALILTLKIAVPAIGIGYFAFIWMPATREIAGPYVILAIIGSASFVVLPVALETMTELSYPVSPEVTSTVAWVGGQICGGSFILISDALVADESANPPKNMTQALIFTAVVALAVVPLPLCLGMFGRSDRVSLKRIRSDQR